MNGVSLITGAESECIALTSTTHNLIEKHGPTLAT